MPMKSGFSHNRGLEKMADKSTKLTLLPVARIRTIMKSSPDITVIGQESLFLITKATELFVQHIAQESHSRSQNKNSLVYGNLAQVVDDDIAFQFLADVLPKKVLARDYLQSLENNS
ncbi:chromatin accessibility complex protein 1-like [Patiria miniata]|uniref:Chromatin accessibility complex protein 1 n=1 Tax=Patiria miniata TaxID=46514 RepID=A0A913ZMA3_PATMI|nr:chromatin accessibility complex protein 1-like [Patiria miniata]